MSLAALLYVGASGSTDVATKTGVVRLIKFVAVSYADRGIRVNCIAPGEMPTAAYKAGKEVGRMMIDHLLPIQPIKLIIATREQADAILWLCTDGHGPCPTRG